MLEGTTASLKKTITDQDLKDFAKLSMDSNPIHLDEEVAKKTIFGKRIAQGLYVSSFISAVLANHVPGPGSIYLSQNLEFLKPVFIGDTITARVTVTKVEPKGRIRLETTCENQEGVLVVRGEACVLLRSAT